MRASSRLRTSLGGILVTCAVVGASLVASCANNAKRDPGLDDLDDSGLHVEDSGPGVDAATPTIEGLASLSIDPPTVALILPYATPLVPVTQAFKAIGTFVDGSTKDVTTAVSWTTSAAATAPISINRGMLSAGAPGKLVVTAQAGTIIGSASVLVRVTGDVATTGTPSGAPALLAAAPTGTTTIAYPLDGALVPFKLGPLEFQMQTSDPSQTLARVEMKGDAIDLRIVTTCAAITGGCSIVLDDSLASILAGASEADTFQTRIRVASTTGTSLSESAPIDVRWTFTPLSGGLYYWRAYDHDKSSGVARFDLDQPGKPAEKYFQSDPDSPPIATGDTHPCVGCHAISADGKKMGLTFGGSIPSAFGLLDIAKKSYLAQKTTDADGYATTTTFAPDGARLVNAFRGKLLLRMADATLADIGSPLFPSVGELLALPYWSGDGKTISFVSWTPGANGASSSTTGDLVRGGQIWIADSDGSSFTGTPRLVVPRVAGRTETYPATSDDSQLLVFNETSCDGPPTTGPYGNDACDGYDDPSARLKLVRAAGGTPVELSRANGAQNYTNSWPRFSPSHKRFRGKNLYWVAFSSRRPYGLRLAGSTDGSTKPQLWFAAITVDDSGTVTSDPSFAPVWLPGQNDADAVSGNHVPQWVTVAVPIIK